MIWVVIILVFLNLFTLSMLWYTNALQRDSIPEPPPPRIEEFMADQLGFDEAQKKQFKVFRKQHKNELKNEFKKIRTLKKEYMIALTAIQPDTTLLADLAVQIGAQHTAFEELLAKHYFELRSICTNEKQRKMLSKVFQKMNAQLEKRRTRTERKRKKQPKEKQ